MGSIDQKPQLYGTLKHPVQKDWPEYDPASLPYLKAPEWMFQTAVPRKYPIDDIRAKVFDETSSLENSRAYLRSHGYTAVKHRSALHEAPHGSLSDFRDVGNINEIYYPEVEELVKQVTGCEKVFIENSIVRSNDVSAPPMVSDQAWKKANNDSHLRMHMPDHARHVRLPHWDYNGRGARESIRNLSSEMEAHARARGIIDAEDRIAAPLSAIAKESDAAIAAQYDGPRYAIFSIWRPIKKITRDPLAMATYSATMGDPHLIYDSHVIRISGEKGDWYRDVPSLRMAPEVLEQPEGKEGTVHWEYVSDLDTDEVLFIKLYDTAALEGQAKVTGEVQGVAHASPDLGDLAHGDTRESIECRVMCFW